MRKNFARPSLVISTLSFLVSTAALCCGGDPTTTGSGAGGASGGMGGFGGEGGTGGAGGAAGCADGETKSCYAGPAGTENIGACKSGTASCTAGQWGACTGEVLPSVESCNAIDDDCNGQTDDGFASVTCGQGACQVTVEGCVGGMVSTCEPGNPSTETCDGTDADCDGVIDNGISCPCAVDGETRRCYSGSMSTQDVSEFKSGTQTCAVGAWRACDG